MRKSISFILVGAAVAAPVSSEAWVSYCRGGWGHVSYGHVGWGGACWHRGWGCCGVSTGTAVAAGMAGLATGAMVGSAVARAGTPAVYVAPAPVVVTPAPVVVAPAVPIGSIYYSLPYGAQGANINGVQYYVANGVYYRPYFGSNGVYYQVVANPI
jgi:hypothetical protein